jgi:hypothetical protein
MAKIEIRGSQYPIEKVFSDDFAFSIPRISGHTPFVLTNTVLLQTKWTPQVVERRQQEMVDHLKRLWRL